MKRQRWDKTDKSIREVFRKLHDSGAIVAYTAVIRDDAYQDICEEEGVLFIPGVLDGILGKKHLMADKVHPNAEGYKIVASRVAKVIKEELLDK